MKNIEELLEEHALIERELFELDTIMQEPEINYSNLVHVLKKLFNLWEKHEKKEEDIFYVLKNNGVVIPVETILFDHGILKKYREEIIGAINSGDNSRVKKVWEKSGVILLGKLRQHMNLEDEVLYTLSSEEMAEN